jgi:O-antigen/teichoic acid export membrane protein
MNGGTLTNSAAASKATRLRDWTAALLGERVLTHNFIVAAGTLSAGVLGVGFQSLVSHTLKPADFGGVFAVITVITLIGLPAGGFSLLMARATSRDLASGHDDFSAALLQRGNWTLLLIGTALGAGLVILSPFASGLLQVPEPLVIAAAIGVPFSVATPLLLGELQGEQRFVLYSTILVGQAALKLLGAVGLGVFWGPIGIIVGLSIASAAGYVGGLIAVRRKIIERRNADLWRPAISYLAIVVPSTLALAVLLSSDVLIVKHFFGQRAAGEYSAVAALGRAIFWGATGVAAVLFPKVSFRHAQGRSGSHLIWVSLGLVAAGGLAAMGFLYAWSTPLLTAFAGADYAGGSGYLPLYAIGMMLLGGITIMVATHQSHGQAAFLAFLLPLTLLEPAALIGFHRTLLQVVQVMDVSMLVLLGALGSLYLVQHRTGRIAVAAGGPLAGPAVVAAGASK